MKFFRFFCLILALLMIGSAMVACGETEKETENTPVETDGGNVMQSLQVNIYVRATEKGEDVYSSDPYGYEFIGSTCTVAEIVAEFMSFNYGIDIEYDDAGKLKKIGEIEAGVGQFWMVSQAKAPKGAAQAEPVDANVETYSKIENGDTIVIYLGGLVNE